MRCDMKAVCAAVIGKCAQQLSASVCSSDRQVCAAVIGKFAAVIGNCAQQ